MALLFIDSFDHYDDAHIVAKYTDSGAPHIVSGGGRCGTNGIKLESAQYVSRSHVFGSTTAIVGFAMKVDSAGTLGGITLLYLYGIDGRPNVRLSYASDGSLSVDSMNASNAWVQVGLSAPHIVLTDTWYYVELKATIHATSGYVEVRLNNVTHITFTGRVLGSWATGPGYADNSADIRTVRLFSVTTSKWFADDYYILDSTGASPWNTFLGDVRVEYLRPRAAGANQAWTAVGAASHWQAVDDNATPDNDTSYVEANAADLIDTNLYQPTGLPSGPVYGAQLSLLAKKTETGPRILAPVVNGVVGTSVAPSYDSYAYITQPYATNPATSVAWTVTTINAIEAGVKVVS